MQSTERDTYIRNIAWQIIRLDTNEVTRMVKITTLISEAMIASALNSKLQFPEEMGNDLR